MSDRFPRLYILMRQDMASMNPGKACAQAAHAANMLHERMVDFHSKKTNKKKIEGWDKWKGNRGFGTTIVLAVSEPNMSHIIRELEDQLVCDIVTDPTYPLKDGNAMLHINVDTCAYIFVASEEDWLILQNHVLFQNLKLMK